MSWAVIHCSIRMSICQALCLLRVYWTILRERNRKQHLISFTGSLSETLFACPQLLSAVTPRVWACQVESVAIN